MKILFVVNWYTSIAEETFRAGVFHYEQSIALSKYCDIRLFFPFEPNIKKTSGKIEKGLYTYRSPWNSDMKKTRWLKLTLCFFDKILKEFNPDLIHANVAYPVGLISLIMGKKHKIPVLHTEHAPIEAMHLNNPVRKIMRQAIYTHMKRNVCVSKDSMTRLKALFPKADFEVIYNGVIDPEKMEFDKKKYHQKGFINCAIVAAFYDKVVKGYQYLLPALKEVNEEGYKIYLHICGGGQYLDYYKDMAEKLGIQDICTFYGQCDRQKVYSIVRQVDFCVSSSIYECSGVSVQEEMLMGKPILVTKSGGANSLTTDFTAVVCERGSVEALAGGLIKMSERYAQFDREQIRSYAYYSFEMENVTRRYLKLYRKVLYENSKKHKRINIK